MKETFEIFMICISLIGCGAIIYAMESLTATAFHSSYKEVKTPYQVFWLNHPDHKDKKWLMQFNKDIMCYGNTFKLTYEYYKSHLDEFEKIGDYYIKWKQLNDEPNYIQKFEDNIKQLIKI